MLYFRNKINYLWKIVINRLLYKISIDKNIKIKQCIRYVCILRTIIVYLMNTN